MKRQLAMKTKTQHISPRLSHPQPLGQTPQPFSPQLSSLSASLEVTLGLTSPHALPVSGWPVA